MKKYFLSIVALAAMLFATSCQESLVEPQVGGTTTFTVQVPDQMGTKAIGDAENTNKLYVQVYPEDFSGDAPIYEGGATMDSDGMFRVSINLIQDQTYGIIFWAQNESSKYNVGNLRKIDLNIEHHNSELGAAFYHTMTFEAGESQEVVLRRPFAQLNLGTSAQSLDTDVSASNIKLLTSRVIVTGIASSFNTVEGIGVAPVTYTYITGDAAVNTDKLNVDGTDYHYISMDYLPVVDNESLVTVQAYVTTNAGNIEHSFTNVPVKKNYRTNIVGNLISSTTDFVVKVNDDWAGPDYKYDSENGKVYVEVGTVEELQNAIKDGVDNITLTENITLDKPLVFGAPAQSPIARASASETPSSFVLDLGGKTITTDLQSEGRHYYAIDNYANLTIVGEGAINARGIQNFGTMTIDGNITITNVDTNGGAAIWNEGDITINGGAFTTNDQAGVGSYGAALNTRTGGKAIVNGGTFIANSQLTYAIINEGETIINNAIVKGRHGAVAGAESNDNTKIYGGSFEQTGVQGQSDHCVYFVKEISGGSFAVEQPTDAGGQVFYKSNIADGYVAVEDNGVWTVSKANVVIGTKGYSSLQAAVDGVKSGETITLIDNVTVSETSDPNGNVVYYTGDKSFTIDLNEKVLTGNTSNVVFRFQKSEGEENTITIKNGTVEALEKTYSAISIGSSCSTKTFVNLEGLTIKSQKPNDMAVRARSGAEFTMKNCTVEATNSAGGICAGGGNVVLEDVTVNQSGWYSNNWNSVALGIHSGAKMTIKSGSYTSNPNDERGTWVAYLMSSGGTLEIKGGTFNGTVGKTANTANACGLICADAKAVVNIYSGIFNSTGAILDMRNNTGSTNPKAVLYGGNFSANPTVSGLYASNLIKVADGFIVDTDSEDGRYIVVEAPKNE